MCEANIRHNGSPAGGKIAKNGAAKKKAKQDVGDGIEPSDFEGKARFG